MTAERLIKTLVEQRRVLAAAQCDETLLEEYSALIRFLRTATASDMRRIFSKSGFTRGSTREIPNEDEARIANLSRADVERLINDESVPRKDLERVAIFRFKVPVGSMRSFSNRTMLIEKLAALLRNEQAHTAIETVARNQGEPAGSQSKRKQ